MTRIKEDLGLPITSLTIRMTDTARGAPVVGLHLSLTAPDDHTLNGRTDELGTARVDDGLIPGHYTVVLEAGRWFAAHNRSCGYGDVAIDFEVIAGASQEISVSLAGYAYAVTMEPHTYQAPPS